MGWHEDDRIRLKNSAYNQASSIYGAYKDKNWSNGDIATFAEDQLAKDPTNRTMYELLKMAVARNVSQTKATHNID